MAKQWHQLERLDHKALKKLQQEREKAAKLAALQEKRQKAIIIGGAVMVVLIIVIFLIVLVKKKSDARALEEAQEKLKYSEVLEYKGTVEFYKGGEWQNLRSNLKFKDDYSFRTSEESSLSIKFQRDNQIKYHASSETKIKTPIIESKEAQIKNQTVELIRGEMTTAISIEGKGLIIIEVDSFKVVGLAGLFKVIYNDDNKKGEVVVKNGLVEVSSNEKGSKPVKLTGFYKVNFEEGELKEPTQASVIQYDWK